MDCSHRKQGIIDSLGRLNIFGAILYLDLYVHNHEKKNLVAHNTAVTLLCSDDKAGDSMFKNMGPWILIRH